MKRITMLLILTVFCFFHTIARNPESDNEKNFKFYFGAETGVAKVISYSGRITPNFVITNGISFTFEGNRWIFGLGVGHQYSQGTYAVNPMTNEKHFCNELLLYPYIGYVLSPIECDFLVAVAVGVSHNLAMHYSFDSYSNGFFVYTYNNQEEIQNRIGTSLHFGVPISYHLKRWSFCLSPTLSLKLYDDMDWHTHVMHPINSISFNLAISYQIK